MKTSHAALFATASVFAAGSATAAPEVVVSVKPIHSLVAAVMEGVAVPKLIVEGAASPHTFTMKPSHARSLEKADVIFWVGENLETFLEKPLDALGKKATVVALSEAPGIEALKLREGGTFESHDHSDEGHDDHAGHDHAKHDHGKHDHAQQAGHDDHDHEGFDMHLWLDPSNAKAMVKEIQARLIKADPEHVAIYNRNASDLQKKIDAMDQEIASALAPVKSRPLVVFHDAYQYFEHHYGINVVGSITVSPETAPGAERLSEIHKKLASLNAVCVFAEPQFQPKLIDVVTAGTKAKSGTLDPEGATLKEGPELYFTLMRSISKSLTDCLGKDA
ncbi:zinc ABC transporter substrate-binding protein ZnuA [Rhizobium sp. FKY42]|uniref:zinc ABC transporter substrate-binding protein ZnuA n=1 Tax=Rhizobium sp. FKY42 TaxID=2562310 RepID=UPI0010C14D15|nr:zinc ABC transporter substrate-binding protein ZnuA [Rhizobium sp. FKY42]